MGISLEDLSLDAAPIALLLPKQTLPVRGLDVWINSASSDDVTQRDVTIEPSRLEGWLNETDEFSPPHIAGRPYDAGRLRLLCHVWANREDNDTQAQFRLLPFNRNNLELITSSWHLPRCYLHEFDRRDRVVVRLWESSELPGPRIALICQTPSFTSSFMTLVLTYDVSSNCATAFLGYVAHPATKDIVTDGILQFPAFASHPLFLPILLQNLTCELMKVGHVAVSTQLRHAMGGIKLLKPFFGRKNLDAPKHGISFLTRSFHGVNSYDRIHEELVQQHALLTSEMYDFCDANSSAILQAFDELDAIIAANISTHLYAGSNKLKTAMKHLRMKIKMEGLHRQRMLGRIEIYLQVLYNLMQQEIAKETKRDSSAMKSIALLTMIFLPATAIATIVAPFIDQTNASTLRMTSQFGIFWAFTAPITLVTIIAWLLWQNRASVRSSPWKLEENDQ